MTISAPATSSYSAEVWPNGVPDDFVFKSATSHSSVTSIGRWLRKLSLDEIPQLINVIKGDMSLVGPRPELVEIAQHYNEVQRKRLSVRPGITGWAQVTGRADQNHGQKIAADLYYIEHASLRLDLKILIRTIKVALRGEAAY